MVILGVKLTLDFERRRTDCLTMFLSFTFLLRVCLFAAKVVRILSDQSARNCYACKKAKPLRVFF